VVYGPGIDLVVTSTPRISTEEKPVTTGSASGNSNTTAESIGLISPGGKQGEHQTVDLAQLTEIYDTKATTLIIGLCSSIVLQHILLLETAKEQ
jgi:molybdenum cofactor biosynthesis enzyme